MLEWVQRLAGRFIVFDGPDGSGKTTQLERFAEHCRSAGLVLCEVREPGGTAIGEQIRELLGNPDAEMSLRCELMLYMASRAQLVQERITPALERGEMVLADRFISSTLAYQGAAGGLSREEIIEVGRVAIGEHWPDLTVIFDVDAQTAARRLHGPMKGAASRQPTLFADRVERRDAAFHRRVRQGYLDQAQADPQHYLVIDASGEPGEVFEELLRAMEARIWKGKE